MTVGFAVFPPGLPAVIQATGQLYGASGGSRGAHFPIIGSQTMAVEKACFLGHH